MCCSSSFTTKTLTLVGLSLSFRICVFFSPSFLRRASIVAVFNGSWRRSLLVLALLLAISQNDVAVKHVAVVCEETDKDVKFVYGFCFGSPRQAGDL